MSSSGKCPQPACRTCSPRAGAPCSPSGSRHSLDTRRNGPARRGRTTSPKVRAVRPAQALGGLGCRTGEVSAPAAGWPGAQGFAPHAVVHARVCTCVIPDLCLCHVCVLQACGVLQACLCCRRVCVHAPEPRSRPHGSCHPLRLQRSASPGGFPTPARPSCLWRGPTWRVSAAPSSSPWRCRSTRSSCRT